ncbi:MAG: hypothetical protein R6U50_09020 [Desulfobacterales bacterium]
MKHSTKYWGISAIAVGLVCLLSFPAAAEQKTDKQAKDIGYQLELEDWVTVGYDLDNDGRIDYTEQVWAFDLQQARKKSQMRAQREGRQTDRRDTARQEGMRRGEQMARQEDMMRGDQMARQRGMMRGEPMARQDRQVRERARQHQQTITGEIQTLRRVNLVGVDQPHVIARIRARDGRTARVDLGPESSLKNIDLSKGDRITVQGRRGTIDNRGMFMARSLQTGRQEVMIRRARDRGLQKFDGEILAVKTATFEDYDVPDQVFARVKLDQGLVTAVNFGPEKKLEADLDELKGKEVTFLAHRADIGGKTALIADQIRMEDRTIRIDWSGPQAQQERRRQRQ